MPATFYVSIETSKSASDVLDEYQTEFAADGWTDTATFTFGDGGTVGVSKDTRAASVTVTTVEGTTTAIITVTDSE